MRKRRYKRLGNEGVAGMLNDCKKREAESGNVRPLHTSRPSELVPRRLHRPLIVATIHSRLRVRVTVRTRVGVKVRVGGLGEGKDKSKSYGKG